MRPRKLAIAIHSLAGGGAERTAAMMANHWASAGDQVTLITLDTADTDRYAVSPAVTREALGLMRASHGILAAVRNNIRRVRGVRRALLRAEVSLVISLTPEINVLTLMASRGSEVEAIVCERADPRHHHIGRVWSWLRRRLYPRSRAVVVQTAAVRDIMQNLAGRAPVYVIPNGVKAPQRTLGKDVETDKAGKTVLAAGRLAWEKGYDLLIQAFAQVAPRHPDWRLQILGDGPSRTDLADQIQQSKLTDRIELAGWVSEPLSRMLGADLFVLPSRYEGFPNALLEAMACGLPAISFACDSGPSEIIRDGVDGLLVPPQDVPALANAMERLMSNEAERVLLAERAAEVAQRFSEGLFFQRWEAVLQGVPADRIY